MRGPLAEFNDDMPPLAKALIKRVPEPRRQQLLLGGTGMTLTIESTVLADESLATRARAIE